MKKNKGSLYKAGLLILFLFIALSIYFYKKINIKTDHMAANVTVPTKISINTKDPIKRAANKNVVVKEKQTKVKNVKETSKNIVLKNTSVEENKKNLEDLISNFFDVYKSLINNKKLDITYINDMVVKNSDFEPIIKNEIQVYRTKYSKIEDLVFKIKSIETTNIINQYSIIVEEQVSYLLINNTIKKVTNNYKYYVVFDKQQSGILKREVIASK